MKNTEKQFSEQHNGSQEGDVITFDPAHHFKEEFASLQVIDARPENFEDLVNAILLPSRTTMQN